MEHDNGNKKDLFNNDLFKNIFNGILGKANTNQILNDTILKNSTHHFNSSAISKFFNLIKDIINITTSNNSATNRSDLSLENNNKTKKNESLLYKNFSNYYSTAITNHTRTIGSNDIITSIINNYNISDIKTYIANNKSINTTITHKINKEHVKENLEDNINKQNDKENKEHKEHNEHKDHKEYNINKQNDKENKEHKEHNEHKEHKEYNINKQKDKEKIEHNINNKNKETKEQKKQDKNQFLNLNKPKNLPNQTKTNIIANQKINNYSNDSNISTILGIGLPILISIILILIFFIKKKIKNTCSNDKKNLDDIKIKNSGSKKSQKEIQNTSSLNILDSSSNISMSDIKILNMKNDLNGILSGRSIDSLSSTGQRKRYPKKKDKKKATNIIGQDQASKEKVKNEMNEEIKQYVIDEKNNK